MKDMFAMIALKNQNTVQRIGSFVTIAVCLALVFLHNPISGYDIYYSKPGQLNTEYDMSTGKSYYYNGYRSPECLEAAALHERSPVLSEMYEKALAMVNEHDCFGKHLLSFSEWKSWSPLIPWLGLVVNLLYSIITVFVLGGFWLIVFRPTKFDGGQA